MSSVHAVESSIKSKSPLPMCWPIFSAKMRAFSLKMGKNDQQICFVNDKDSCFRCGFHMCATKKFQTFVNISANSYYDSTEKIFFLFSQKRVTMFVCFKKSHGVCVFGMFKCTCQRRLLFCLLIDEFLMNDSMNDIKTKRTNYFSEFAQVKSSQKCGVCFCDWGWLTGCCK